MVARKLGIDYGEFDVLRDKDRRIYVVDANNTPYGPPNELSEGDCTRALVLLANEFVRLIEHEVFLPTKFENLPQT